MAVKSYLLVFLQGSHTKTSRVATGHCQGENQRQFPRFGRIHRSVSGNSQCRHDTYYNWEELFGNENESSPALSLDYYFKIVCSQKLIRSLAGIAVHICLIRRSAGNFFLKRANKYFFVRCPNN